MSHLLGPKSVDVMLVLDANKRTLNTDEPTFRFGEIQERWDALEAKWGAKVVYATLERLDRRGYIEYGVSLRSSWLTSKGIVKLREFAFYEVPMDERLDDYNWQEAFFFGRTPNRVPPLAEVDTSPVLREQVVFIEWYAEGENDGPDWLVGGSLRDGRWFFLAAGCDYTGWDCQSGGQAYVALTREDIERFGMGDTERERLGVSLPEGVGANRRRQPAGW